MLQNIDKSILKELDKQKLRANEISIIMNNLSEKGKHKFCSYLLTNTNELLSFSHLLVITEILNSNK